jgi:uncharacterized membrane protein YeaQ/YmgE (transglycosylase-associated protein family)
MVVFAWIVAGALLGAAASALNGTAGRADFALNVAAGIAGVLLGGWLLGVLTGASAFDWGVLGMGSLLVSLLGASILLIVPHVVRVVRAAAEAGTPQRHRGASTRPEI